MSRVVSPVVGVVIVVALVLFLAIVIGVFVTGAPASSPAQPIENLSAFVGPGDQCVLTATFDPSAHDRADRLVVEIEGYATVFDSRKDYWRQDVRRGSNLSVYAVDLPEPGLGSDGAEVLLQGHFGPECQLVRGETA